MCGLVGTAGILGLNEEKAFRQLLVLDTLRGEDSTGIAAINAQMGYSIAKEVGTPYALFDTKRCEVIFRKLNRVLIGHNRSATVGNIIRKNAHPFDMETIIGVHNGTLRNKWKLDDAAEYVVDSENLFHHMEKNGVRQAIDIIDGAYALVWWDKFEYELNFLRNHERPLYITRTTDDKTIFWASEKWMLDVACGRNGIKIQDPISLEQDMHFVFTLNKDGSISKPKAAQMKSVYVAPTYHNTAFGGFSNQNLKQNSMNNFIAPINRTLDLPVAVTNNVIAIGKATLAGNLEKKLPTSTYQLENYSSELVALCSNRKDVTFKIIGVGVDKNKANYVHLMDFSYPRIIFRMHVPRNSMLLLMIGRKITADVEKMHQMSGERAYFRVPMSTHKLLQEDGSILSKSTINTGYFRYDNGKGQLLTKVEWEKKYPTCAWCFDALYAEDHGNRLFTQDGGEYECFCGKCANDLTATEGLILKTVY